MSWRPTRLRSRTAATRRRRPGWAAAALARARACGMRTVLDAASAAPLRAAPQFMEWAGPVDLLLANEAEAAVLGDGHGARQVVVKRGAGGASWTDGTRTVTVAAR